MGPPEGVIYEALRDQISGALKGDTRTHRWWRRTASASGCSATSSMSRRQHRVQPLEDLFAIFWDRSPDC